MDFAHLAASLCMQPTYLTEIIPQQPTLLGSMDAAKPGVSRVFFDSESTPHAWHHPFPPNVQADLVSFDNPHGEVTNSNLKQAGLIAQANVMCHSHDTRYATDNTPMVSCFCKGAVSSDTSAAPLPSHQPTPMLVALLSPSGLHPRTCQCHGRLRFMPPTPH